MIAVGIDIGGTNTKIAIVRESGETLSYVSFPTDSHEPFDLFLEKIHSTVLKFSEQSQIISNSEDIKGM
jgi:predicted NBD/HSP70 family sugar kinase